MIKDRSSYLGLGIGAVHLHIFYSCLLFLSKVGDSITFISSIQVKKIPTMNDSRMSSMRFVICPSICTVNRLSSSVITYVFRKEKSRKAAKAFTAMGKKNVSESWRTEMPSWSIKMKLSSRN